MSGVGVQRIIAGPKLREEAIRATREHYFNVKQGRAGFAAVAGRTEGPSYTSRGAWLRETSARLDMPEELHDRMLGDRQ